MQGRVENGGAASSFWDRREEGKRVDGHINGCLGGARILIVDDDRTILEILSATLSSMGFRVSVANGAEKGLTMFLNDPFDLVFTDLNMPGMDGWSLASHIKGRSPQTPVVLITGEMEEEVRGKLGESCVDKAIFKPFGLAEIIDTARRMLCLKAEITEVQLT